MLVPKRLLPHTVVYQEFLETDRKGAERYADPVTIRHVRVDAAPVYSRRLEETAEKERAVVYCYAAHTIPLPVFRERSQIHWKGRVMTVVTAAALTHPLHDGVWGYELEVV